jgi:hypothetical protein
VPRVTISSSMGAIGRGVSVRELAPLATSGAVETEL